MAFLLAVSASVVVGPIAPAAGEDTEVMSGVVDDSWIAGPRWVGVTYIAPVSGEIDFELSWAGGGDLAFDLRVAATNEWIAADTSATNPKVFTAHVDAGTPYRLAVWARSGEGAFGVSVGELPATQLLSGRVDSTRATASKWVSTHITASDTGPATFELDWAGQANLALDVRVAATSKWVGSSTKADSPKSLTVALQAGVEYRVAVWALSGVGDFDLQVLSDEIRPLPEGPNIIVINLDDARPEALEVMPNVQQWLVDAGTSYVNAYVAVPSCCPSRAALMTGQYGHNNGQQDQSTPSMNEDESIQRYLFDAGYFTAHTGKYLHYFETDERAPNWDRWTYFRGGYYDVWVNVDGTVFQSPLISTDLTFDSAVAYLDSFDQLDDDRPFYIQVAPIAPHSPWIPEPKYADAPVPEWDPSPAVGEADRSDKPPWVRYTDHSLEQGAINRTQQLRTLMTVDDQVEHLMQRLDDLGELDNTLVIFTSDNGFFWGEHGRRSKFLPYNEANEVPFVVRWPGSVDAGTTSSELVSHVDILPTVLAAAGVQAGHVVDGRDILDPEFIRSDLLVEYWEDEANGNFIPTWASVRNEVRVYSEYYDESGEVVFVEYYDLVNDPWEMTNLLSDGNPENDPPVAAVSSLLGDARTCTGASCP
ncbi:MAG: sulfatase [Actinomycetia bacterium]|nr:sulfatase [Actinomycetes bacterium]